MLVDTKPTPERIAVREINGGLNRILNAIKSYLRSQSVPIDKIDNGMLEFSAAITCDVDEIIGILGLQEEYRAYLGMLASCEE